MGSNPTSDTNPFLKGVALKIRFELIALVYFDIYVQIASNIILSHF